MRIASLLACVFGLLFSACDSNPSPMDGTDAAASSTLTCSSSLTLCTNADVTVYASTGIADPAGGTVAPGQYRLAWIETADASRDGQRDDLVSLDIAGTGFNWSGGVQGEVGTFSVSGTDLTLHYTERCELGARVDSDDREWTYPYTASGTELRLYETVSGFAYVRVFRRMADPSEVCEFESSPPSSAGDSATCEALNCFCAYTSSGTLSESSCPF